MAINLKDIKESMVGYDLASYKLKNLREEILKTSGAYQQLYFNSSIGTKEEIDNIEALIDKFKKAQTEIDKTTNAIKTAVAEQFPKTDVEKNLIVGKQLKEIKDQLFFASSLDVDSLVSTSQLIAINEFQTIQARIAEIDANLTAKSGQLAKEKEVNLLSEFTYQQKLAELHKEVAAQLQEQIIQLREFKEQAPDVIKDQIQKKIDETDLKKVGEESKGEGTVNSITRKTINSGLNENLGKVFSGEMTFAEMSKGIYANVQQELMQQLTQQMMQNISQIMTQMSMNLISMISEPLKEGIGSALNSLFGDPNSMLGGLGEQMKGLFSGMDEMFGGFFSKLFQGTGSNFSSMFSSDGLSGLLSLVTTFFLADGGMVRGPGTETSDSIPAWLSNGEFVTRAAVVKQPGMLPLLHDLNRNGISALADYSLRIKHATGGLAGIPAPSAPSLGLSSIKPSATTAATTVENAVNLHVYDDPQRIINSSFSDNGMESYYLKIERNPQRLKSILGV